MQHSNSVKWGVKMKSEVFLNVIEEFWGGNPMRRQYIYSSIIHMKKEAF